MLNFKKTITLNGESTIDGVIAESCQATIDSDDPENLAMNSWIGNQELYKANRAECRKDYADFGDKVFEIQEQMIAEKKSADSMREK